VIETRSERLVGASLIALALVLLFTVKLARLVDPDIFLHVAVGERILDQHEIPRTGWLSGTRGEAPWVDNEWGTQVVFAETNRRLGVRGLVLLMALLPALAALLLAVALRRRGLPSAAVAVSIALAGAALGLVSLRPQLVTYVFFAAFLLGVSELVDRRSRAPLVYLPPLAALWANFHGGLIVGLVLLAIPAGVEAVRRIFGRPAAAPLRPLLIALVSCTAASCLNPYGWRQLVYPLEYALRPGMTAGNVEWQPVVLAQVPGFALLLGVVVVVFALAPRRPVLHDLAVAGAFSMFAFEAWRHLGLAAYALPWAVAPSAAAWLADACPPGSTGRRVALPAVGAVVLLGAFGVAGGAPAGSPFHYDPNVPLPVDAAGFYAAHRPPGVLFNRYEWGGYLTYRLKPDAVVFIDGRNDLYGESVLADYQRIMAGDPGVVAILERYGVGSAMLVDDRQDARLIRALRDAGWVCVHRSEGSVPTVLLVRGSEANRDLIARFGRPLDGE
jgi:hypothetical protein